MAFDPDHDLFSSASAISASGSEREVQAPDLSPDELVKLLANNKLIVTQFKGPYDDYQVVTEIKIYSRFCDYVSRVLYKGKELDSDYIIARNVTGNNAIENLARKKSRYNYKDAQSFDTLGEEERTALLKRVVDVHIKKCALVFEFLADAEKITSKRKTRKRIIMAIILSFILLIVGGIYLWFFSKPGPSAPTDSAATFTTPTPVPVPLKPAEPSIPDTPARPRANPPSPLPNDLKCKLYPNEEGCKKQ